MVQGQDLYRVIHPSPIPLPIHHSTLDKCLESLENAVLEGSMNLKKLLL